jgi:hypothetical protein
MMPSSTSSQNVKPETPRRTASSLLARFLPGISPQHKKDQTRLVQPTASTPSNEYVELGSPIQQQFQTPQGMMKAEDNGDDVEEIEFTTPKKLRSGLRERKSNMSLKALENVYTAPSRQKAKKKGALEGLIGADLTPVVSDRVAVRMEIASKTAGLRNRFLVEKKDFWLPLLPPNNFVRKLVKEYEALSPEQFAKLPTIAPYVEVENQPKGIKAVMKPYQLSGLSFMLYLHKNVSSRSWFYTA